MVLGSVQDADARASPRGVAQKVRRLLDGAAVLHSDDLRPANCWVNVVNKDAQFQLSCPAALDGHVARVGLDVLEGHPQARIRTLNFRKALVGVGANPRDEVGTHLTMLELVVEVLLRDGAKEAVSLVVDDSKLQLT